MVAEGVMGITLVILRGDNHDVTAENVSALRVGTLRLHWLMLFALLPTQHLARLG